MKLLFPTELSHGNLMFGKHIDLTSKEHPFWDNPIPTVLLKSDVDGCESNERLSNFRKAGYFASCFPEGDGLTFRPLKGQDNDQIQRDVIEHLKVELDTNHVR